MNRPELYYWTLDILSTAYMNDTLAHSTTLPCAIGNLIAANNGYKLEFDHKSVLQSDSFIGQSFPHGVRIFNWIKQDGTKLKDEQPWFSVFASGELKDLLNYEGRKQIASTGYYVTELMRIEAAFENCDRGETEDDYVFNGLMNVIEVLDEIHGVKQKSCVESLVQ